MRRILMASAALAMAASPAWAQVAGPSQIKSHYSAAYARCLASPGGQSTMGQIGCITDEAAVQNGALNAAYGKSQGQLDAGGKASLQAAERAWMAFRDADCASQGNQGLGTLQRVLANQCMLNRTIERTLELDNFPVNMAGPAG